MYTMGFDMTEWNTVGDIPFHIYIDPLKKNCTSIQYCISIQVLVVANITDS